MNYCKETKQFRKTIFDTMVIDLVKELNDTRNEGWESRKTHNLWRELFVNLDEVNEMMFEKAWDDEY
tara:strand:+ start:240 stop:440 length:201 start_codon:yes stop_codon:yes gene_type:complete